MEEGGQGNDGRLKALNCDYEIVDADRMRLRGCRLLEPTVTLELSHSHLT